MAYELLLLQLWLRFWHECDTPLSPQLAAIMKLETPQFDARFPNQNQTKACWQYFVDYQKVFKRYSLASELL